MEIPFEYMFGVDIAIKKLRPGANFQLEGTRFTQWQCPNNSQPPTWTEVIAQLESDRKAYEEWQQNN